MKKAIYKITNNKSGKAYIGQSSQPEIRWNQHIKCSKQVVGKAIQKYGVENFKFEILEWAENFNEREKFWIAKYNTFQSGYNQTVGGEGVCKISDYVLKRVKKEIKEGESFGKISKDFNVSLNTIGLINNGKAYHSPEEIYPLFKKTNPNLTKIEVQSIEAEIESAESLKSLAEKMNLSHSLISLINKGEHKYSSIDKVFPILTYHNLLSAQKVKEVENLLKETKLAFAEIALEIGIEREVVGKINKGQHTNSSNKNQTIRKRNTLATREEVVLIEEALIKTKKLKKEIAKDFNRSDGFIKNINQGKHKFSSEQIDFPIR